MDAVFKALADPTRRLLLDRLREQNGQTLRELCERLEMARQSVTQHLDVLVRAGLVTVVRRGRERLHHLNPVPIHEIEERWIAGFDRLRLDVISAIKNQAEQERAMSDTPSGATGPVPDYVYVTYIKATAEQVWHALTDADLTARYWGHANVSDWQSGSAWEHRRTDGSSIADVIGEVLVAEPPTRLVVTFDGPADRPTGRRPATVTFLIEAWGSPRPEAGGEQIVRLTVTHQHLPDEQALRDVSRGWPAVLANLKSLLETGAVLPQVPWEMP
ncbi:ArsR/SmtB family transcription factor [Kitasatospora humi]|uniref:ArsR/SmtB family transcription factor n=1 Tax=Kitasatospora humi TaxID=2893891 RepID=UPI0027E17AAB|nr:metalloregulator ArsR/SmtB family transcription factor [Kitasatospora humi]